MASAPLPFFRLEVVPQAVHGLGQAVEIAMHCADGMQRPLQGGRAMKITTIARDSVADG